jgi:hypothetical protein
METLTCLSEVLVKFAASRLRFWLLVGENCIVL